MKYKKYLAAAIAATMLMTGGLEVSAASANQESTESLSTQFTFEYKNDPTYMVTIPEAVTLDKDGTEFTIEATDVANLDNQKVSVTIAGTDKYRNQMVLEGKSDTGRNASLRYQLIKADGTVIETTGGKDQVNGVELASFTENGTAALTAKPVIAGSSSIIKGVTYTGTMTFGIELAAVE